jgi:hypothetical protein
LWAAAAKRYLNISDMARADADILRRVSVRFRTKAVLGYGHSLPSSASHHANNSAAVRWPICNKPHSELAEYIAWMAERSDVPV